MSAQIFSFPVSRPTQVVEDADQATAHEDAAAAREVAIEHWLRHYFRRDREIDGAVPKTPRKSFPNLEKILKALLMLVVEDVRFTPEQYKLLCRSLFEWLLQRSDRFEDASQANLDWALAIIERQDLDGLAIRIYSLQMAIPDLGLRYRAERSRIRKAFGLSDDEDGERMADNDRRMIKQAFQLFFAAVLTPEGFQDLPVPSHKQESAPVRGRPNLKVMKGE